MKYTQVPTDTFSTIQINAGVLLNGFTPDSATITKENIIGATTGGSQFSTNPEFTDFGEDIDNVPANTKQLKRLQSYDPTLSTTFVTIDNKLGKKLIAAADLETSKENHIIPRSSLTVEDFSDIWLVGDYSDKNGTKNGGFVAIHIMDALNTGGFQWQTGKDEKGQFAAEFHGHYDIENIDKMPFEIYIQAGTAESPE